MSQASPGDAHLWDGVIASYTHCKWKTLSIENAVDILPYGAPSLSNPVHGRVPVVPPIIIHWTGKPAVRSSIMTERHITRSGKDSHSKLEVWFLGSWSMCIAFTLDMLKIPAEPLWVRYCLYFLWELYYKMCSLSFGAFSVIWNHIRWLFASVLSTSRYSQISFTSSLLYSLC